ncbi:acyl carrier protein [Paraflavitalea speifideaquila]|uniref:acyl carrier protein n=1 Tax=Paraflavitalea speifideaquila TaxID=3076558 RepID=UPI0028E76041|nr:phosphopantetheine-binding protein [Paraflavitalea speifideiaquila]
MVRAEAGIGHAHQQAPDASITPFTTSIGKQAPALIDYLKQLLAAYLHTDATAIEEKAGYYEMGLHSASLLQITADIGRQLGIDLPPTILFEYPNIALLAAALSSQYTLSTVADAIPVSIAATTPKDTTSAAQAEDIAVIGVAGKYPQADNLQVFWETCRQAAIVSQRYLPPGGIPRSMQT